MQVLPTFRALVRIFCVGLLSLMFGIVGLGAVLYVSEMRSRVPLCPKEQYEAALQSTEADKIAWLANHCPEEQSASLRHRAAELGNSDAQRHLMWAYQRRMLGSAVKQDLEKSRYWFHKLEQRLQSLQDERKDNLAFSKMREVGFIASELAEEFESGVLVPKDLSRAFRLYLQAAEAGNSEVHERVASMYERGEGTEQNLAKAFEFYLNLAKYPGAPENTERIADMYLEGRGVDRNLGEAFKWLHRAAEWPTPSRLCKLAKVAREVNGKWDSYKFGFIALFLFERRLVELNDNMNEEKRPSLGNLRVAREDAALSKNMPECLSFVLNVKKELSEEQQRDVEKSARTWMKDQLGFERGGFIR